MVDNVLFDAFTTLNLVNVDPLRKSILDACAVIRRSFWNIRLAGEFEGDRNPLNFGRMSRLNLLIRTPLPSGFYYSLNFDRIPSYSTIDVKSR